MAHVLVVDDDPDVSALVDYRLRAAGHDVMIEPDGEAGLAAAIARVPDVIVLDWMMPRRNGLEVCLELRSDRTYDATKIIMLTAKTQLHDIERAFAAGANDYVLKPFSPRELAARVESLLK